MSEEQRRQRAARFCLRAMAIKSHRAREPWAGFWARIKSRPEANAIYGELLHLHSSGEPSGMYAVGDVDGIDPWIRDDQAHDTHTVARCQLTLPFGTAETMTHTGGSGR